MITFKKGDRVRVKTEGKDFSLASNDFRYSCNFDDKNNKYIGTIVYNKNEAKKYLYSSQSVVGVKFDRQILGGHGLNNACTYGYGQYVLCEDLELYNDKRDMKELYNELKQPYIRG